MPDPGILHMTEAQAAEHVYMEYRAAKKTWRRFTGKPVRHFRRTVKKAKKEAEKPNEEKEKEKVLDSIGHMMTL